MLDVLPSQALSGPCEQVFSCSKQIAMDLWAALGAVIFEELVIMNSAWGPGLYDKVAWNAFQVEVEEIPIFDYEEMLINDNYGTT